MTINGSQCKRYLSFVCSSSVWKFTPRMRAIYSALSIYRATQNKDSAIRDSISVFSKQDPGILAVAALGGIHHQRILLQCHARQPAGHNGNFLSVVQAVGTQVHVASRNASERGIVGGHARKRQHGLRN